MTHQEFVDSFGKYFDLPVNYFNGNKIKIGKVKEGFTDDCSGEVYPRCYCIWVCDDEVERVKISFWDLNNINSILKGESLCK